jgi:pimeloyl-ACP methyl ester carboxylesterase
MKGLTPPPKQDTASRVAARMLVLVVLLVVAGVAIYTAVTNQRIDLTEDIRSVGLDLASPSEVDGLTVNVAEDAGGPTPIVFLHDVDVAGGLTLAPLSQTLDDSYHGVRVDLPGFGFSDRVPFVGTRHTVAGMADTMAAVLQDRFDSPVLVVGVGLGGEIGAELAYTYPELLSGLVMVDVDFWKGDSMEVALEKMPWIGRAATYAYETGGQFALDNWSPYCEEGGWCANPDQVAVRSFIVTLQDTTDSMYAFRRTSDAALAPANLSDITVPTAYVLSLDGPVSDDTVQRIRDELTGMAVVESDTFQAHLEDFSSVKEAIAALS